MTEVVPPYTPKNTPVKTTVPFNGAEFKTTFWPVPADIDIKGRILFVHGFAEYDAVYVRLFDDLSAAGYEVFFFDQRGSGLTSPGKLKGKTDEFHVFNDLDFFLERNLNEIKDTDNKEIFLLGHSMGGGISLNYGIHGKYKDQIRGIIVSGPLILLHPETKPGKLLYSVSEFLLKFIPNFRIDTALNPKFITNDPEWRKFATTSPHIVPFLGSLRQCNDFIERGKKLVEPDYAKDFTPPLFIIHGKEDKINDPASSKTFIDLIPIEDKKLSIVDVARHSVFIETEEIYQSVLKDTLEWLEKH